jgi:predicted nucleotidyltransferase
MGLASKEDINEFVEDASTILGDRVEDIILYGSYAREEHVPGSDVDILFLVDSKKQDDWNKISKIAGNHFLDKNIRFSPKVVEKKLFDERKNESAGFYSEVAEEGVEI